MEAGSDHGEEGHGAAGNEKLHVLPEGAGLREKQWPKKPLIFGRCFKSRKGPFGRRKSRGFPVSQKVKVMVYNGFRRFQDFYRNVFVIALETDNKIEI